MQKALPCILGTPCANGICNNDNIGGYGCSCYTGYIGTNCNIRKWDLME